MGHYKKEVSHFLSRMLYYPYQKGLIMSAETNPSEEPTVSFENTPKPKSSDEAQRAEKEQKSETLSPNNINEIIIEIQKRDGVEVSPAWWEANIENGTEEEMLAQFLIAYERDFPRGADGIRRKNPGVA